LSQPSLDVFFWICVVCDVLVSGAFSWQEHWTFEQVVGKTFGDSAALLRGRK
jgi:hypothetical protein